MTSQTHRHSIEITPQKLLHSAARQNDVSAIEEILANVAVDVQDSDKATALHFAAAYGALDATRLLLAKGANPNALDYKKMTPLHSAIANNQLATSSVLLSYGASTTAQDQYGNTPLWTCLFTGKADPQILRLLLEHGADPLQNEAYEEAEFRGYEAACEMMRAYMPQR